MGGVWSGMRALNKKKKKKRLWNCAYTTINSPTTHSGILCTHNTISTNSFNTVSLSKQDVSCQQLYKNASHVEKPNTIVRNRVFELISFSSISSNCTEYAHDFLFFFVVVGNLKKCNCFWLFDTPSSFSKKKKNNNLQILIFFRFKQRDLKVLANAKFYFALR